MSCDIVRDLLSARLDAPLPAGDERLVREHLAACAACAETDRCLESLVDDLALLAAVDIPEGLSDRILARVPSPRLSGGIGTGSGMSGMPRRGMHELRRVAGWAAVMLTASLSLLGRDFAGQVADNIAPIVARAQQEATRSRLSGTSLLASLDARGEAEFERLKAGLRGSEEQR